MDLESGSSLYVEARTDRKVNLEHHVGGGFTVATLTSEEARTLANALLAAVVEAEAHQPR